MNDVTITISFIVAMVCFMFDLYPVRCYVCNKWGWSFKMDNRVLSGSSPETCESAWAHKNCREENQNAQRPA